MEKWETLVSSFPAEVKVQSFGKALQTASIVLKEDLAPFEIEWIIQTLLFEPMSLLNLISSRSSDDVWTKPVGDAFKLLAEVVDKYPKYIEAYFEDLVTLCQASYDAQTKKQALLLTTSIVKHSAVGASLARKYITALQDVPTCKAPTALLVGAICEHLPEAVSEEFTNIWRIYLNLLESNKNTDTVIQAVLQGIFGLLKHFGCDLPTAELFNFYEKLSKDYIRKAKCEKVCRAILENYTDLFKERVVVDNPLRDYLWTTLTDWSVAHVLHNVYRSIATVATAREVETVISELSPRTHSRRPVEQLTALRALSHYSARLPHSAHVGQVDVYSLEARLRNGDGARTVAYCIEINAPNCDKLVQTLVLFYDKLSRCDKTVVTHALLNAAPELRATAVLFLTLESCRDVASLDKLLPIWGDLFNSDNGKDIIVVEKSQFVFEDFMNYYITTLDGFLNDRIDDETLPEKLQHLLTLSSHILTLQCPEEYTKVSCIQVYEMLMRLNEGSSGPLLKAVRATVGHLEEYDVTEIYKAIEIDGCRDESLLCEACLTLIQAPHGVGDGDNILKAMQIILSRNDVEPKTVSLTLMKLEYLFVQTRYDLDQVLVNKVLYMVEKLRSKGDVTDKHARILNKDVTMFLGKYSTRSDINNNKSVSDNNVIAELEDTLMLIIPNPSEARSYKINLQTILQAAIIHEDPSALQTLLAIICANLSSQASVKRTIPLVCRSLCAAHATASCVDVTALQEAVLMAGLHLPIMDYITQEKSPGVRRMLSDALEGLLVRGPGSEEHELMVSSVGDHILVVLDSDNSTARRAGLDITESLIVSLKTDNKLAQIYLPKILLLISETNEVNSDTTFDKASTLFIEIIELFDSITIDKVIIDLLRTLLSNKRVKTRKNVHVYRKITRIVLLFVKKIFDYKNIDCDKLVKIFIDITEENIDISTFYVLALSKAMFEFNDESRRVILCHKNSVLSRFFERKPMNDQAFEMEAVLKFLQEYAVILLELQYQKTLLYLSDLISNLHPKTINHIHTNLSRCLSTYKQILKKYPQIILKGLESHTEKIPLEEITNHIEKDIYLTEHGALITALKLSLSSFDTDLSFLTAVKIHAQRWPRMILQLFSRNDDLKSRMTFLTDLLTVAVQFLTLTDVKKLVLEGSGLRGVANEMIGVKFCTTFMAVFYKFLVDDRLLLDCDLSSVCTLLNDVVKFYIRRRWQVEDCRQILELVELLWPTFAKHTTFDQKYTLLQDLACLPDKLDPSSAPYQWVGSVVSSGECVGAICLLPGGEGCSGIYRTFAGGLASRVRELSPGPSRALLEALASTGDRLLLHIVASLAADEESTAWWEDSLDACMASLASRADLDILLEVFPKCWEGLSRGICQRMMVPLLRYSTQSICIKFFAHKQTELLSILRKTQRGVTANYSYHKTLVDYTRALCLLQVAFEKISGPMLESLTSPLYQGVVVQQTWYLVREGCKLCVTLMDKVICPDESLKNDWRIFQCAAYSCLTSAIISRRPAEIIYKKIFDPQVWETLVDNTVYDLPLRPRWLSTRHSVVQHGDSDTSSAASTLRSRLFLRTLSENPLLYDLHEIQEEKDSPHLQILPPSTILKHECNTTLYTALCHVTTLPHSHWRDTVVTTLAGQGSGHVKWLIAQAIVNSKDVLTPHASTLRPALLAMVVDTAIGEDGKKTLNGLHLDVLDTLSLWKDNIDIPSDSRDHISIITKYLISTILENRHKSTIYKSLVEDLTRFLDVYGCFVEIGWDVFEAYVEGPQPALKECLYILKRITKHNIYVRNLLPMLVKYDKHLPQSSDIFGKTLALCDGDTRRVYVEKFRVILEKVRKDSTGVYVRMLYYAQMGYAGVCDEKNYRLIIDLVHKLDSERSKCLQIITSYISQPQQTNVYTDLFETLDICELFTDNAIEAMQCVAKAVNRMGDRLRRRCVMIVAGYCGHSLGNVRRAAFEVMVEVFEGIFTTDHQSLPKRQKTVLSPILKSSGSQDPYLTTVLYGVARGIIEGFDVTRVEGLLSKDMAVRFAECFYLTVYQLCTHDNTQDVSVCLSAMLSMLFSELRSQDSFKGLKLRDEPLITVQPDGPIKLLTMSKTYQGTLRSQRSSAIRRKMAPHTTGLDVQISIDSILDTLLQFTKTSPEAARSLFIELMKTLTLDDKSDANTTMSQLLADVMMNIIPGDLTVIIIEACRVMVDGVSRVDGFEQAVAKLKDRTKNTEGAELTILLHEEVLLRTRGYDLFMLGMSRADENYDAIMEDSIIFSIEGLQSAFGLLSNWDKLTLQQKSLVERDLPTLWTSAHAWDVAVDNYSIGNKDTWFNKMVAASRGGCKRDTVIWLREMDRWPRKAFEASAIVEAIQFESNEKQTLLSDIHESDCLAEWAARLMIRSSHLSKIESEPIDLMLSHSHELAWTVCANERGLAKSALDCIKRNTVDLYESETLAWLEQKVLALRLIGLKRNDSEIMRKALDTAEKYTPQFNEKSPVGVNIAMNKLILQLNCDLKSLSNAKLKRISEDVSNQILVKDTLSQKDRTNLAYIYELAIIHYDESWSYDDTNKQNTILKDMCEVLNDVIEYNIPYDVYLSVIFNRLDQFDGQIDATTARAIFNKLEQVWSSLDQFTIDQLKRHLPAFAEVTSEFSATLALLNNAVNTEQQYKLRLQLICDAGHSLLSCCAELSEALKAMDGDKWRLIFDRMKNRIFENPYAGSDYQLLHKYKKKLYDIYVFDTDKTQKKQILKEIQDELVSRPAQKCLRVSQLCPTLCVADVCRNECLTHLLGLRPGVEVVRVDEQITVFTDSIRRPCVFTVLLSNGTVKRYLHKSGEQLKVDAAVQRVGRRLVQQWGFVGYNVTPLGEDSGLIEYLENYERVRSLLSKKYNIDTIPPRAADRELILAPTQASVLAHHQLCSGIPSHALRSVIESTCCTTEDFLIKKRRFQESVCSITVLCWLFGVGDRHLQNIMYNSREGTLCSVDWAAILQYGVAELPPARLTRIFIAMCNLQGLESRIQTLVTSLRQSYKLYMHFIHESFKWMGQEFDDKKPYVQSLLEGKALPHEVTKDSITKSGLEYKEKYIELLDNVFYGYENKDYYSVEEQVSNLLQHCTDPKILSVTRSGWEPWL